MHAIADYAEALKRAETTADCNQLLMEIGDQLGADRFAYFSLIGGTYRFETTYDQEWTQRYEDNGYVQIDPVAIVGRQSILPVDWGSLKRRYGRDRTHARFFRESDDFGLRHGISFPMHGPGGTFSMLSLAAYHPDLSRTASLRQMELQAIALFYHATLDRLAPLTPEPAKLSPREREVLLWALRGKSAWDTSEIIGISKHTVVFHIENAKAKLGVRSKIEAVTKAVMAGVIVP